MFENVTIEKLVHGGQGLGQLADGRKVFVWGALPGEQVQVRIIKNKRSYAEAIAEEVIVAAPERRVPDEENYLATSPWQIMTFAAENTYKKAIVEELFAHQKVVLPTFADTVHDDHEWQYRNKMEYGFWGDEAGLHLALYGRGSHAKQIVAGSKLAMPALDAAANALCAQLSVLHTRSGDLQSLIVRCDQDGKVVASLMVSLKKFTQLSLPPELQGLRVYYVNPNSSVRSSRLLYELGNYTLQDKLLGKPFRYDGDSFFQINLPVFEKALAQIKARLVGDPIDMYAGVGVIGLSAAKQQVTLVESHAATAAMAQVNAQASDLQADVVEASTERALDCIVADRPIIFDPPRAGLHPKIVEQLLDVQPPQIIYLSCDPATQARDLAGLQQNYAIDFFEVYNFFPHTPHIETLAVLSRK